MIGRMRTGLYSSSYSSDTSYLAYQSTYGSGVGTKHVILGCHGRGGYSYQYAPVNQAQPGYHTPYLVDTSGLVMLGVDHSAINAWGDASAMRALDDAYTYLTSTFLMPTAKIAIQAWSMGGLTALNWAIRNPTKVAGIWCWNPASDIRYFHDASGAYTPTYSVGGAGATQGAYTAEIDSVYGPSTTHTTTGTIPASGGAGITLTVANAKTFADANVLGGTALPQATVNAATFTYTSKTDTTLVGCVSTTASTIAVTSGQTITSTYATQSPAYNPWTRAAAYSTGNGITFPIKIAQATDDVTVPPGMNNEAVNGFIARAANANITARTPALTGGHSAAISNVPSSEVAAFFTGLSW